VTIKWRQIAIKMKPKEPEEAEEAEDAEGEDDGNPNRWQTTSKIMLPI